MRRRACLTLIWANSRCQVTSKQAGDRHYHWLERKSVKRTRIWFFLLIFDANFTRQNFVLNCVLPVKYRFRRIWNDIMGTFQWRGKSGDSWRFWSFQRFPKKQLYLSHPIVLEDLDCQNKSGKCKDILQMYNLLFRCKRWVRNYNFFLFFSASIEKVFFSIEKVVQHFVIFIISIAYLFAFWLKVVKYIYLYFHLKI